jgi:hypothetical protein
MIIRRILRCGAEIGRCIEITRKDKSGYYGHYIGENKELFIALNLRNFKKITVVAVEIRAIEFEALKHAFYIHHDLSPIWEKVLKVKPEIVKFWNRDSGVIYVWPSVIKRRIFGHNTPTVYIEIKSKMYVSNS